MDFSFTEAQRDLAALTRDILGGLTPERLRAAEAGPDRFDERLWQALCAAGVPAATLPESAGGQGFGLLEQCAVLVELGRAVAPVPYLWTVVTASAIARFGDASWISPGVLTAALAEDEAPVTVEPDDGQWLLSGSKPCVPAGLLADVVLVPADDRAFLVRPDDPGVSVHRQRIVDGDSEAWLDLDGVRLGPRRVLGGPDVLDWLTTRATVGLCALQLGVVERALELTAQHARDRVQFERPIGSFQAVAQRLADAYIDVEAIRLTLWQAAWRVSEGLPADVDVATAKFWAADGGHRVAHTAVHVHGGVGIDMDHELHRYFLAAKRNEFTLGGATAQLRRIGAALASVPA